ncbi:MAG TPA: hypothetical protein EYN71_02815 [Flavobacteriales bacterium]|nr:hypothetical protein [Flavobacteriales bacterium]
MKISSHLSSFFISIELCAMFFVDNKNACAQHPAPSKAPSQLRVGFADRGNSITLDAEGNIYTTGSFAGTIDIDPGLAKLGSASLGTDDTFVCKLDASGNFEWGGRIRGPSSEWSYSIAVDTMGNVYTTGRFSAAADFDPLPAVLHLSSTGNHMFISKLDTRGNFLWVVVMRGPYTERGHSITLNDSGVYSQRKWNKLT